MSRPAHGVSHLHHHEANYETILPRNLCIYLYAPVSRVCLRQLPVVLLQSHAADFHGRYILAAGLRRQAEVGQANSGLYAYFGKLTVGYDGFRLLPGGAGIDPIQKSAAHHSSCNLFPCFRKHSLPLMDVSPALGTLPIQKRESKPGLPAAEPGAGFASEPPFLGRRGFASVLDAVLHFRVSREFLL